MKPNRTTQLSSASRSYLPVCVGALLLSSFATQAAVLAAWDDWANRAGPPIQADDVLTGFAATTISGTGTGNRFNASFGSGDGTYGNNLSGANTVISGGLLPNNLAATSILTTFSITNNTGSAYSLDTIHFDWILRNNSIKSFELTYDGGGLGPASTELLSVTYLDADNPATGEGNNILNNYDITLSDFLTDTVLDDGETASFSLTPTEFFGTNSAVFDNLAIQGTAVPEPSSAALLGLGGLALILRRKK